MATFCSSICILQGTDPGSGDNGDGGSRGGTGWAVPRSGGGLRPGKARDWRRMAASLVMTMKKLPMMEPEPSCCVKWKEDMDNEDGMESSHHRPHF